MEVILKEDVANLGHRGDVVKVADGYGRNFLLPRKLALQATLANKKQIDEMKASAVRRSAAGLDSGFELFKHDSLVQRVLVNDHQAVLILCHDVAGVHLHDVGDRADDRQALRRRRFSATIVMQHLGGFLRKRLLDLAVDEPLLPRIKPAEIFDKTRCVRDGGTNSGRMRESRTKFRIRRRSERTWKGCGGLKRLAP